MTTLERFTFWPLIVRPNPRASFNPSLLIGTTASLWHICTQDLSTRRKQSCDGLPPFSGLRRCLPDTLIHCPASTFAFSTRMPSCMPLAHACAPHCQHVCHHPFMHLLPRSSSLALKTASVGLSGPPHPDAQLPSTNYFRLRRNLGPLARIMPPLACPPAPPPAPSPPTFQMFSAT